MLQGDVLHLVKHKAVMERSFRFHIICIFGLTSSHIGCVTILTWIKDTSDDWNRIFLPESC